MGTEGRQRIDEPDEGRDREARPDGGERVELGDDLDHGRRQPDLFLGLAERRVLEAAVHAGTEPASREGDLALVGGHGVGPLGQDDVGLAVRLEQGDEHRRRATAGHLERRRLGRWERGAPLAHLGQGEPAAVGRDVAPRGGATDAGVRGAGDALLPAPCGHSPTLLSPSQSSGSALAGNGRQSRRCHGVRCARGGQGGSMNWNFGTVFESVADAIPEHTALVQDGRRRTWREFDERAARLAAALRDLGLRPDSKIAFYLYNCNEYLEALLATFKLRAVPANVNYRYTADELAYQLENSDAEAVVFHGSLGERVDAVRDPSLKVRAAVQVDDGSPLVDGALRYEDLIESHEPMERIERSGDDLIFLYTGGTTGMPKAVMWRHEDLFGALAPLAYSFFGLDMPEDSTEAGALARKGHQSGLVPVHPPAAPPMHGTGQVSTLQALFLRGGMVDPEPGHISPPQVLGTGETRTGAPDPT